MSAFEPAGCECTGSIPLNLVVHPSAGQRLLLDFVKG